MTGRVLIRRKRGAKRLRCSEFLCLGFAEILGKAILRTELQTIRFHRGINNKPDQPNRIRIDRRGTADSVARSEKKSKEGS